MVKGKKGQAIDFLVKVIPAILIGVLLLFIASITLFGALGIFQEGRCVITSTVRDKVPDFPDACETSIQLLWPDELLDNGKLYCPASTTLEEDEIFDPSLCLHEHIYQLAARCWSQRGRGTLDPGDFDCYFVCIGEGDKFQPAAFDWTELDGVKSYEFTGKIGDEKTYESVLPVDNLHVVEYVEDPDAIYAMVTLNKIPIPTGFLSRIVAGRALEATEGTIRPGEFIKIEFVDDKDWVADEDLIVVSSFGASCSVPEPEEEEE